MAPRKRAAKKVAAKPEEPVDLDIFFSVEEGTGEVPSLKLEKEWPDRIVEKHAARYAANKEWLKQQRDAKKQRLIDNGVPPEKQSL